MTIHPTLGAMCLALAIPTTLLADTSPAIVRSEFIYETAPFPSCHASTIVETSEGLVAAWFGGKAEKSPDVGIWSARLVDGKWTAPVEVANGVQPDGKRYPCWNPVLFQPRNGALMLFYKVGPSPDEWWGMVRTSDDAGRTWSEAENCRKAFSVRSKTSRYNFRTEIYSCPTSTEDTGWMVHFERSSSGVENMECNRADQRRQNHRRDPAEYSLSQGWKLAGRGAPGAGQGIHHLLTTDAGHTWSAMTLTELPNPNSGIDAVTLADGRFLLVYNHTPNGRTPLNVALSKDGIDWKSALTLESEPGEFSYPAVIQARDGLVHITYTWQRQRIRHVVLDPAKL